MYPYMYLKPRMEYIKIHTEYTTIHVSTPSHMARPVRLWDTPGYNGIQQEGYIRSCVSPQVAHVGYMGHTCCHDVSYRSGRDTCGIHSGYVLDTEKHVYLGREYQTHAGYMRDTCSIHSGYMFKGCIFARLVGYMRNPCWIQLANMYP